MTTLAVTLPAPKTKWAIVEALDPQTGNLWDHIIPILEAPDSFSSAAEAEAFQLRIITSALLDDLPCLTDENDCIIATYIGHALREDCPCGPTVGGVDGGMLVHRQAN